MDYGEVSVMCWMLYGRYGRVCYGRQTLERILCDVLDAVWSLWSGVLW